MSYFLNFCYLLLLTFASPWLLYAAIRKGKYREGFSAKLLGRAPKRSGREKCIWLHAVSVGEVNLLATLLEKIEKDFPQIECVISTTTKTGYNLARRKYAPRSVFYCPLDFSWAVKTALRRIRPDLLILAELELWPNLIWSANRRGIKIAVINARLGEKSFQGYSRIRPLIASLLGSIDLIAAQNKDYSERFLSLGANPDSVFVSGSLKFDGALTDRNNPHTRRLAELWGIAPDDRVFLAGSTQGPEESLALDAYRQLSPAYPNLRLILVPRHPERFEEVATLLEASEFSWIRRSQLDSPQVDSTTRILLVDAIGELGAWWGTAQIAFVGGSLGKRGGQNMIEPAAYGAAVSFGPNTRNFRDIVALLLEKEAAVVIHDGPELTSFVQRCLDDPQAAERQGNRAQELVFEQMGAVGRTLSRIKMLLSSSDAADR